MKKTKQLFISVFDGICNYIGYYTITALWIYLGLKLLGRYELTFFQSFGFVIAARQIISLFRVPADNHLKKTNTDDQATGN